MSTTTTQAAIDLMPQLRDILGLPAELDLPRLVRIEFAAYDTAPGWTVTAQLPTMTDEAEWDALLAWSRGAEPVLSEPQVAAYMPSGMYRKASVTVVVADVSVTIWTHVDGEFVPPVAEPVRVTGPMAALIAGGELVNGEY